MTNKAYIVANKEQELDVLKKFERKGFKWFSEELPTEFIFSDSFWFDGFPYVITEHNNIGYIGQTYDSQRYNGNIVYDGRKEENMYKVTKEFMNELIKWRDYEHIKPTIDKQNHYVSRANLINLPDIVYNWWAYNEDSIECNKRLIAIIQWLNGEDVFEVEAPHKFVVRSEHTDRDGDYIYVGVNYDIFTTYRCDLNCATKFYTREEAQEWANSHQVVVEIDEEGNEV